MPTAAVSELISELDHLLEPERYKDYGPNGLQVPGAEEVGAIVSGVSAQLALFERAVELGAGLVLVHHGILWNAAPRTIDAAMKRRLALLFEHDVGLAAYHLPLDAHPEVGNNALLAAGLGAQTTSAFAEHGGQSIGRRGEFAGDGVAAGELFARVEALTGRAPLVFDAGPERVQSIGIVSGAGAPYLDAAIALGLDAFLTGEPAERVMAQAREAGIHFIAAGHYATETLGIRHVGERLAAAHGLEHTFVDIPNPI